MSFISFPTVFWAHMILMYNKMWIYVLGVFSKEFFNMKIDHVPWGGWLLLWSSCRCCCHSLYLDSLWCFFYGQSVENYARKELWILWQLWNSKAQEKKGIRVLMNMKKINISVSKLQTRTSLILHRWQVVLVCERKHKKEEEKKMRPQVNWAGTGMLLLFTVWCRKAIPLTCSNHICPHQGSRFIYMTF